MPPSSTVRPPSGCQLGGVCYAWAVIAGPETSRWRIVGRALRRRCPRCGSSGWFRMWLRRTGERCPVCGIKVERHEGFMLGSLALNTIVTFFLLMVVIVVGFVLSYPHIAVAPILAVGVVVAIVVPVVLFPISVTVWAAVDLIARPVETVEAAEALTAAAAAGRVDAPPP